MGELDSQQQRAAAQSCHHHLQMPPHPRTQPAGEDQCCRGEMAEVAWVAAVMGIGPSAVMDAAEQSRGEGGDQAQLGAWHAASMWQPSGRRASLPSARAPPPHAQGRLVHRGVPAAPPPPPMRLSAAWPLPAAPCSLSPPPAMLPLCATASPPLPLPPALPRRQWPLWRTTWRPRIAKGWWWCE